jgi:hypothetical protein
MTICRSNGSLGCDAECDPTTSDRWVTRHHARALEADVVDAVWAATEPLLPAPPEHPLGCHQPRACWVRCPSPAPLLVGWHRVRRAYATFSTFSYETVRLLEDGATRQSLLNIAASLAGGLAAAAVGPCPGRGSLAVAAALRVATASPGDQPHPRIHPLGSRRHRAPIVALARRAATKIAPPVGRPLLPASLPPAHVTSATTESHHSTTTRCWSRRA